MPGWLLFLFGAWAGTILLVVVLAFFNWAEQFDEYDDEQP